MGSNPLDVLGMARSCRAENYKVGAAPGDARVYIGKDVIHRNSKIPNRGPHARGVFVADSYDLCPRMVENHAQQVTHVHVIEIDSGYSYF
jgi:hypothetical protein